MRRSHFLGGLLGASAWFGLGASAFASEGLNLDTPAQNVDIRVFLHPEPRGRYRGRLASVSLPDGRAGTLNTLTLEEYLYGVLPAEMPSSWPYAALEAQAILARTFAMKRRNPKHAFDLVAGSADQEYGGMTVEALSTNAAIDASAGLIVLYNGVPASIAYMTCCGGHTENAERVWGNAYPYLGGVDDPYCATAPNRNWSVRIPWGTLAQESGARGTLERVELDDLGPGGRPGALRFIGSDGIGRITTLRMRSLSGWRLPSTFIRSVQLERNGAPLGLNPLSLNSVAQPTAFLIPLAPPPLALPAMLQPMAHPMHDNDDMNDDFHRGGALHALPQRARSGGWGPFRKQRDQDDGGLTLLIQGSGSGHGVGLCQWGANAMARAGATAQEIVAHYFPTTRLGAAAELVGPET